MRGSAGPTSGITVWTSLVAKPSGINRQVVVLVYTERRRGPHVISLRKAEKYEARYYIAEAKKFQG